MKLQFAIKKSSFPCRFAPPLTDHLCGGVFGRAVAFIAGGEAGIGGIPGPAAGTEMGAADDILFTTPGKAPDGRLCQGTESLAPLPIYRADAHFTDGGNELNL